MCIQAFPLSFPKGRGGEEGGRGPAVKTRNCPEEQSASTEQKNCRRINNKPFRRSPYLPHHHHASGRAGCPGKASTVGHRCRPRQKPHFHLAPGAGSRRVPALRAVLPALRSRAAFPPLTTLRHRTARTFSFENKTPHFLKGEGTRCPLSPPEVGIYMQTCILCSLLYDQFTETGCSKL